jgi:hypothetical protein
MVVRLDEKGCRGYYIYTCTSAFRQHKKRKEGNKTRKTKKGLDWITKKTAQCLHDNASSLIFARLPLITPCTLLQHFLQKAHCCLDRAVDACGLTLDPGVPNSSCSDASAAAASLPH